MSALFNQIPRLSAGLEPATFKAILEKGLAEPAKNPSSSEHVEVLSKRLLSLKSGEREKNEAVVEVLENLYTAIPGEEEELFETYLDVILELPTSSLEKISNTGLMKQVRLLHNLIHIFSKPLLHFYGWRICVDDIWTFLISVE